MVGGHQMVKPIEIEDTRIHDFMWGFYIEEAKTESANLLKNISLIFIEI